MQLVQSAHALSLYSTRVLLARTTCITDDAAYAISARLKPSLDPRGPGAHYLCHQCCRSCTLRTPRALTQPVCSWRGLLVPPMIQLVQSPQASSLNSTRTLLARTTCTPMLQLVQSSNASGFYFTRFLLAGTNCLADATACAVSESLGSLLDPGSPCKHKLSHRCYSLCSLRTPRAFTRHEFPVKHELSR